MLLLWLVVDVMAMHVQFVFHFLQHGFMVLRKGSTGFGCSVWAGFGTHRVYTYRSMATWMLFVTGNVRASADTGL